MKNLIEEEKNKKQTTSSALFLLNFIGEVIASEESEEIIESVDQFPSLT
jgi:hypothetical protein